MFYQKLSGIPTRKTSKHSNFPSLKCFFHRQPTIFGNQKPLAGLPRQKKWMVHRDQPISYHPFFLDPTGFPGQKRAAKRALASTPPISRFYVLKKIEATCLNEACLELDYPPGN